VAAHFAVIEKYKRFWYDLTELALLEYGLATSLRRIVAKLSSALGGMSLSTLTSRIHAIQAGIEAWKRQAIEDVPDVVQLDGIWFSLMVPTGKKKRDKRGRLRVVKRKVDRVVLVAVGIWTKTGRREIVDWHIASSESADAWLHLLDRLYERGLTGERGLKLIVHDGNGGVASALSYGYFDVLSAAVHFPQDTERGGELRRRGRRERERDHKGRGARVWREEQACGEDAPAVFSEEMGGKAA
jgi:hypothetical protein